MSKLKLIIICAVAAVVLFIAGVQLYNMFHYTMYKGYTAYLKDYTVPEGTAEPTFLEGKDVPRMRMVAENGTLALYTNTNTAEVAVYDKRSGQITYSNPQNADQDEAATNLNKSYLKSQIIVDYYGANRNLANFNSWDHAVDLDQFEYAGIPGGIRYTYTLGDFSRPTGIIPLMLSLPRMDELVSKMAERDGARFRSYYRKPDDPEGYYTINDGARQPASVRNILRFLESAGYTEDDYYADMAQAGSDEARPVSFVISIDYVLNEDSLQVSVPMKLVREDGGGRIARVQLLRYFGAGGTDEEGYVFVPNGSGSLIRFNNGKVNAPNYSQFIYGMDPLLQDYFVTEQTQKARLPVFGISKKESGLFASIESGDSLASVSAYVSGMVNSYNFVYPTFTLRSGDRLTMFGATDISADLPIVEADFYDVNCSVRYYFLTGEQADYSGMAGLYRNKLINEGVLKKKEPTGYIPLFMDLTGGAQGMGFFLGAQFSQTIPMTTFEQASDIINELYQMGVMNQFVNYQGWFNRGYYHDVADKVNVIGKLGGQNALEELARETARRGGRLYGEVGFQHVTFASRRYDYSLESSRYYGAGYIAAFGQVHPVSNMQTNSMGYREINYNLISPKFLGRYVDKFTDEIADIGIAGISLKDLGDALHSDKRRTEVINREQGKDIVLAQFEKLTETEMSMMLSGGNLYALRYADALTNAPMSHNAYFLVDEEVPFYQMVVHGYLDYAGEAINLTTTDPNEKIAMRLIASGASPHYTFTHESSSLLKKTGLNHYRSTTFENWKNDAAEVYALVNEALADVSGQEIVRHEIIEPGVTAMYYANGVSITVDQNAVSYVKGVWQ